MAEYITAPFTDEQVDALNGWQESGLVHPFTCGFAHSNGHMNLVATHNGWICSDPRCPYTQDWAHEFMTDVVILNKMRELLGQRVRPYSR